MAPEDMGPVLEKATGSGGVLLAERGTSFGYHNLVVDMRALEIMRQFGWPVVFDATHSVQLPGGEGTSSGGQREFVAPLARAAVAVGVDALFVEVHPEPVRGKSDSLTQLPTDELEPLLSEVLSIDQAFRAGWDSRRAQTRGTRG